MHIIQSYNFDSLVATTTLSCVADRFYCELILPEFSMMDEAILMPF